MQMAARVNTVRRALQRLREQQARMGLGLRGDMQSASERMEQQMDEAEAALGAGDAAAAQKRLDAASRELETLEKFLNL